MDERNQCGGDVQDRKILRLCVIKSKYWLLQAILDDDDFRVYINSRVFNILSNENDAPALKLEAQPWCTQCLWRSKRTNRRQPGIENSLGGKVSIL